jgi:hypothetical protein
MSLPILGYACLALAVVAGFARYQLVITRLELANLKTASAAAAASASATYRNKEQALIVAVTGVANDLQASREQAAAAVAALEQRLRERSRVWAPSPATAAAANTCRDLQAPAAEILPGPTRGDLVALAGAAEQVRQQLLACQAVLVKEREGLKP